MKKECPHCDLPKNRYHEKMQFTNSYLKEKDRGEHE